MLLAGCVIPLIIWAALGAAEYFYIFSSIPSPGCYICPIACSLTLIMIWGALKQILFGSELNNALKKAEARLQPEDGKVMAAIGTIHPIRDALTSPITGQRCSAYSYDAFQTVTYEDSDNHTQSRDDTYYCGFALIPSVVKTMYGEFKLLGFSLMDKFPQTRVSNPDKDKDKYDRLQEYLRNNPGKEMSGTKLAGAFSAIEELLTDDDRTIKIDWIPKAQTMAVTDLELKECVLVPGTQLTVFGVFDRSKQGIVPRKGMNPFPVQLYPGGSDEVRKQLKTQTITMAIFSVIFFIAAHGVSWLAFKDEISDSIHKLIIQIKSESDVR